VKLGVIGGGAWGTALAQVAASGDQQVLLWAREPDVVADINAVRENRTFLSGIRLHERVRATADLSELAACDAMLVVTPAQHLRATLAALPPVEAPLILCAKGMEEASTKLMHEVAAEEQPRAALAVLSGPTFAHEVASGCSSAATSCISLVLASSMPLAHRMRGASTGGRAASVARRCWAGVTTSIASQAASSDRSAVALTRSCRRMPDRKVRFSRTALMSATTSGSRAQSSTC
jgi:hypothetical protein